MKKIIESLIESLGRLVYVVDNAFEAVFFRIIVITALIRWVWLGEAGLIWFIGVFSVIAVLFLATIAVVLAVLDRWNKK